MKKFAETIIRGVMSLLFVSCVGAGVQAAQVSSITTTGTGFTLISSSITNHATSLSENDNFLTLNLQANKLASPFNVRFNLARSLPTGTQTRDYTLILNVTNNVGREIPGFDVENGAQNGLGYSASLGSVLSSPDFTFEDINPGSYNLASGFRFGGLNGGGHALAVGAPAWTATLIYSTTNTGSSTNGANRFSSLNFTANPEPTTLLLGSLAMIPAAVVARRRRKAASELIEA